ncbi:hypothetical protein GWI72_13540 [Microvirga tunisiensis]|uniref:Uncharacterized protein n=1 Tax=Pannonibacter tanglangensis TaxID=2750084 RepID=A0A7X5F3V0_9HYPH|nr:hypothetical protein [Pannonibacter sp. XCT-53]NBN79295.1 hypothetical protein [Pannonibacter sp. XCT-53]
MFKGSGWALIRKFNLVVRWLFHRSEASADQEIDHQGSLGATRSRSRNEAVNIPPPVDDQSTLQPAQPRNGASENETLPEILPNLDFEPEITSESFFKANQTDAIRGTFHRVETVRWDHTEADWNLEEYDLALPTKSAVHCTTEHCPERENQKVPDTDQVFAEVALERLRAFALERRWRAAASALSKAATRSARLSKREHAAIEHVLNVADTLALLQDETIALRNWLSGAQICKNTTELPCAKGGIENHDAVILNVVGRIEKQSKNLLAKTRRPTQKRLHLAACEIRNVAADRNWLSPKSSRALKRFGDRKVILDRSDRNALIYLLDRCDALPELAEHVANLRRAIAD